MIEFEPRPAGGVGVGAEQGRSLKGSVQAVFLV